MTTYNLQTDDRWPENLELFFAEFSLAFQQVCSGWPSHPARSPCLCKAARHHCRTVFGRLLVARWDRTPRVVTSARSRRRHAAWGDTDSARLQGSKILKAYARESSTTHPGAAEAERTPASPGGRLPPAPVVFRRSFGPTCGRWRRDLQRASKPAEGIGCATGPSFGLCGLAAIWYFARGVPNGPFGAAALDDQRPAA